MKYVVEEYTEGWETIHWQEGFSDELEGLPIEDQLRCYALTTYKRLTEIPYKELESRCRENQRLLDSLELIDPACALVIEGKLVAFKIGFSLHARADGNNEFEFETIRPYEAYCYDVTSDNNGAGYKETYWYKYLVCLPANHTLGLSDCERFVLEHTIL